MYRVSIFKLHIVFVPKVFFLFSANPFHVVNFLLSHSCCHFQVDIILKFFEVVFLLSFFAHGHTTSTICIISNLKQSF